jgi:hypothetical protein
VERVDRLAGLGDERDMDAAAGLLGFVQPECGRARRAEAAARVVGDEAQRLQRRLEELAARRGVFHA